MIAIDWILDSAPSILWHVMRDLSDGPAEIVAAERAQATESWGAQMLALQAPDGDQGRRSVSSGFRDAWAG